MKRGTERGQDRSIQAVSDTLARLIDRGSKLWLDEPEPCRKH